jgi:hypothetical protein
MLGIFLLLFAITLGKNGSLEPAALEENYVSRQKEKQRYLAKF